MSTATSTRTTAPVGETNTVSRPEFFRLPGPGGDPHFGISRSHYYEWERDGKLKLVRLRREGATRGIVLIPYAAVKAIIEASI